MKKSNMFIVLFAILAWVSVASAGGVAVNFDGRVAVVESSFGSGFFRGQEGVPVVGAALTAAAERSISWGQAKLTAEDADVYLMALALARPELREEIEKVVLSAPLNEKKDYMSRQYIPHLIRKVYFLENKNADAEFFYIGGVTRRPGYVCAQYETKTTCGTKKVCEWVCDAVGEMVNGVAGKVCGWACNMVEDCSTQEVCVEWDQV